MPRPLDEILGLKKTAATHNLRVGDKVRLLKSPGFCDGREGEITSLDKWNRPVIRLDIYPNLEFHFHHSYLEKING